MGLTVKIAPGQWQGVVTQKMYYAPRECEESVEAQEKDALRKRPMLSIPKDCKPGSAEQALFLAQEENLSNVQREQVKEAAIAYNAFRALHPECIQNELNDNTLCEYFYLKGVPFVEFNGAKVPLATSIEMWNEAYQWKMSVGAMQIDRKVMSAQQQQKAEEDAREFVERKPPTEDELEVMADEERSRRSGAWIIG
jgi:hypothetical protein